MDEKGNRSHSVEWLGGLFSMSLSYDQDKLRPFLIELARYVEVRQQLLRKRVAVEVELVSSPVLAKRDTLDGDSHMKFLIRLEKADGDWEFYPLGELTHLIEKFDLYVRKNPAQLKREAKRAEKHIGDHASQKLGHSLLQFLFEASHAATGSLVTESKRKELESIGSMVDRCVGLRLAGKKSPVGLRRGGKRELEEMIRMAMILVSGSKQSITYDAVADNLQTNFGFVPALTGETLRKAVSLLGLNWKLMKKTEKSGKFSGIGQKYSFIKQPQIK
jgi:hypothetical protein